MKTLHSSPTCKQFLTLKLVARKMKAKITCIIIERCIEHAEADEFRTSRLYNVLWFHFCLSCWFIFPPESWMSQLSKSIVYITVRVINCIKMRWEWETRCRYRSRIFNWQGLEASWSERKLLRWHDLAKLPINLCKL